MTQADVSVPRVSKAAFWTGWIFTILPVLLLAFSGSMKLMQPPQMADSFKHLGWPPEYALGLGIVELSCAVIFLFPPTSVLGAILVTGYLGGAIATHVRIGELPNMAVPIGLGVLAWLGLYLRDPRIRALAPLRR